MTHTPPPKDHDYGPKPMEPQEFYDLLRNLIARMQKDSEFKQLAFFNKHQFKNLDEDFKRMMKSLGYLIKD